MNEFNIKTGSVIESREDMPFFGIKAGFQLLLYIVDGVVWCVGGLSWSIDQLTQEIKDGIWRVIK